MLRGIGENTKGNRERKVEKYSVPEEVLPASRSSLGKAVHVYRISSDTTRSSTRRSYKVRST